MPNRIIKESICTSEKVSALTDFEFRLWVGMLTQADDAGRGDARPAILKGSIFPLRDRVTAKDIDGAIHGLAAKGCVSLYTVGGKPYFWFPTWGDHQRIRDCRPKYPAPEEADAENDISPQVAADCGKLPQVAADCGYNPIQSESNPNPNPNTNTNSSSAVAFDAFWEAYPRKVGKSDAQKAFAKVKVPVQVLIEAINKQKTTEQWCRDGGKFIPYPATWLNGGRWQDEVKVESAKKKGGSLDLSRFDEMIANYVPIYRKGGAE